MSSATLFKIAGTIFCVVPIAHTDMFFKVIQKGLKPVEGADGVYASKVSWNQANGYFLTAGLLCFKWASEGLSLSDGLDRYIFSVLMATHTATGFMYARKGVVPVYSFYWTVSLLMGIAALKQ